MIKENLKKTSHNSLYPEGNNLIRTTEYINWITELKNRFRTSQIKAAVKVNSTLLEFYWELGYDIVEKQKKVKWGSGFLKQLSNDLMNEFPNIKGFSYRNIKFIRQWYMFYSHGIIKGKQLVSLFEIDKLIQDETEGELSCLKKTCPQIENSEKIKSSLPSIEKIEAELNDK